MITTVSKALAQQIVNTVHDICGCHINFINKKGIIFASTDQKRVGTFHEIGKKAADTQKTIEVTANDNYKGTTSGINLPVTHNGLFIAVIGISGNPDEIRSYAHLAERITRLLIREQELSGTAHTLSEKKRFLLNCLTSDNPDMPEYALSVLKDFHIDETTPKRIIIIRIHDSEASEPLSSIELKITRLFERLGITIFCDYYPDRFVALADDTIICENMSVLQSFASDTRNMLHIGIGCAARLYRMNLSLHTAHTALANAAAEDMPLSVFDDLTLEIILNSVPPEKRSEYLSKVLSGLSSDDILLLKTYYQEGQSLNKTCSRLFLHKNTLQYKLNRIHRICGFDPRDFKDAVTLYLAIRMQE